ncbi:hypothetical protein ACDH53_18135 [Pseudomonas tremae]|uniref:Uncharacterized protein n=1 Tax=Pseudomonas tremae TaxID=200454 RepID=A0ABV4PGW5_9PSED|nr:MULTISPECIES: hypothetical protein [Pseudomonas syringae group]RMS41736.1 hypothetical protein ALP71_200184 [Pseudomonas coronafaciens pv. garcae]
MAKKPRYIVVDGCIQEGRNVIIRGSPYTPASKEMEDALVAERRIAMSTDPRAQEASSPRQLEVRILMTLPTVTDHELSRTG